MTDLDLTCRCGAVRGTLHGAPEAITSRVLCYCSDCRAFVERLGCDDVLDAQGGTDICQLSPARLEFSQGRDQLACLRLTEQGPLRWYARCCRAPLANTVAIGSGHFVGVLRSVIAHEEDALRAIDCRIMTKEALADPGDDVPKHAGFPVSLLVRLLPRVLLWALRGDARRSPFFDAVTGAPIAEPALPESA